MRENAVRPEIDQSTVVDQSMRFNQSKIRRRQVKLFYVHRRDDRHTFRIDLTVGKSSS